MKSFEQFINELVYNTPADEQSRKELIQYCKQKDVFKPTAIKKDMDGVTYVEAAFDEKTMIQKAEWAALQVWIVQNHSYIIKRAIGGATLKLINTRR